jgi:hypothetical protein
MTSQEENEPTCGICQRPKSDHSDTFHEFSASGDLVAKKPNKSNTPSKQSVIVGRLIGILSAKGILTPEEVGRLISEDD